MTDLKDAVGDWTGINTVTNLRAAREGPPAVALPAGEDGEQIHRQNVLPRFVDLKFAPQVEQEEEDDEPTRNPQLDEIKVGHGASTSPRRPEL